MSPQGNKDRKQFTAASLAVLNKELARLATQVYCVWLEDRGPYPNEVKIIESTYGDANVATPYRMQCFTNRETALTLAATLAQVGAKTSVRP